mmetsp:Transcript_42133/g.98815  ORF Transcript_42133/g.98815 Transcript_42133/m.98815 type:complete len:204 (-) Transcript_42133:307-918(-)
MRDHVGQRPVPGEERRRHEGQARVLHPSVREGGREAKDVVALPLVGTRKRLRDLEELFSVLELARRRGDHAGLSPDFAALTDVLALQVSDGDRNQVRARGHGLLPSPALKALVQLFSALLEERRHEDRGPLRRRNLRRPRALGTWAVLAGEQGTRVDGLTLGEHEWLLLASCLRRRQPGARRAVRGRVVVHDDLGFAPFAPRP